MRLLRWLVLALVVYPQSAFALPMYALSSGRTCGNCHVSPTYQDPKGWNDPDLAERKCNLSCMACHVSPGGGGLRNTSGRYYGQSSLSMLALQERSYSDYQREVLPSAWVHAYREWFGAPSPDPKGHDIPSRFQDVKRDRHGGWLSFGKPLTETSEYAFWDGRYGDLNADPFLQLGADVRSAYWSASETFFPMQLDLHAAVHPIEHLSFVGTLAARGRVAGPEALVTQPSPLFPRNAYVMAHELPLASWARAGVFVPSFGTYLDDHTSFIRQYFGLDISRSDASVLGVELGFAPNYPFATVSVFKNLTPVGSSTELDGVGASFAVGWRDLWFSLGAHGLLRRREPQNGGDLDAAGISWGLSPFALSEWLPFALMGELNLGRAEALTGETKARLAFYQELWWLMFNGVNLRLKYDLGSRDLGAPDALEQRLSLGLDVAPIPGLSFLIQGRMLIPSPGASADADVFLTTHVWL